MADLEKPAPPTTTTEENLHTKSARAINLIWEFTQAMIACSIVGTIDYVLVWVIRNDSQGRSAALMVLVGAFNLVIGFYFGRTNHARSGGMVEK